MDYEKTYEDFAKWLDKILEQEIPDGVIAFHFNLYEGSENTYDVQIIGASQFDEEDPDWPCYHDLFSSGENIFYIDRISEIAKWEQGLTLAVALVKDYLKQGKYAKKFLSSQAIGVGFVDGDTELIYRAE